MGTTKECLFFQQHKKDVRLLIETTKILMHLYYFIAWAISVTAWSIDWLIELIW